MNTRVYSIAELNIPTDIVDRDGYIVVKSRFLDYLPAYGMATFYFWKITEVRSLKTSIWKWNAEKGAEQGIFFSLKIDKEKCKIQIKDVRLGSEEAQRYSNKSKKIVKKEPGIELMNGLMPPSSKCKHYSAIVHGQRVIADDITYTSRELGKLFGKSDEAIRIDLKRRKFPFLKVGHNNRYSAKIYKAHVLRIFE